MKKINSFMLFVPALLLGFCTSCADDETGGKVKQPITVEQTDGSLAEALELEADTESASLWLTTNCEWAATVSPEASSWLSVEPSEGIVTNQLRIKLVVEPNEFEDAQTASITFISKADPEKQQTIQITQKGAVLDPMPVADLLDIVFKNDGTAEDISPRHFTVNTFPGSTMLTYYSSAYSRYTAQFANTLGATVSSGFYNTSSYANDQDFKDALSDGFTMESLCRLGTENPGTAEVKMLGSTYGGGVALMILKDASAYTKFHPNAISGSFTFLANISGTWMFPDCNVIPVPGRYYHLVGVYNQAENRLYIYIDGVEMGSIAVTGSLKFPTSTAALCFGVGCCSGTSTVKGTAAWNGDVAIARIYSNPLTAKEVTRLWKAVKTRDEVLPIAISNLQFLPQCKVGSGYKYKIYGDGFTADDKIQLASVNSESGTFDCETEVADDHLTITIPATLVSDKYRIMLKRGSNNAPLGFTQMNVSASPELRTAKIIAHRGCWTSAIPQNSITALVKAQEFGAYAAECDVWITTDDVIVVHHDPTFTGAKATTLTSAYADIKDLTLANGEKLPTFDAFLDQAKKNTNTKLMVEVKPNGTDADDRITTALIAAVKAKGMENNVEFIAFNYEICKKLAAAFPNMIISYLSSSTSTAFTPSVVLNDGIKCIDYSMALLNASSNYIDDAHALGMYVNVWTVDSVSDMLNFIGANVDFISTNYTDNLKTLINKKFVESK